MRALIFFTVLLLSQLSFGQDQQAQPAAPAAVAAPAATAETPATPTEEAATPVVPSAFQTGIFLSPSFTMFSREVQGGTTMTSKTEVSATELNLKGGYVFNFGLFAGMNILYSMGESSGLDLNTYAVGPTIGYSCQWTGLFIAATYNLLGKTDNDTAGEYDEVTGLQFDISYPMQLADNIKIGPQLTWKRLKNSDHSVPGTADLKTKEFAPSLSAWFYF